MCFFDVCHRRKQEVATAPTPSLPTTPLQVVHTYSVQRQQLAAAVHCGVWAGGRDLYSGRTQQEVTAWSWAECQKINFHHFCFKFYSAEQQQNNTSKVLQNNQQREEESCRLWSTAFPILSDCLRADVFISTLILLLCTKWRGCVGFTSQPTVNGRWWQTNVWWALTVAKTMFIWRRRDVQRLSAITESWWKQRNLDLRYCKISLIRPNVHTF